MTPEGAVKTLITKLLRSCKGVWFTMPVPSGYGESTLDYIGCDNGRFFAIEAKAPGKKPTPRQMQMIDDMRAAGGTTFIIDGLESLKKLEEWLIDADPNS